jgi:hypothetical protein
MIVALLCMLAGMVLGQRFKVLLLVPATALLLALTAAGGALHGDAFWPTALVAVAAAASLQTGYLFGLGIRHALMGNRAASSDASLARSAPTRHRAL